MNVKMDHVGIKVNDINESVEWFGKYFGFSKLLYPGIVPMAMHGTEGYRCCIANANNDVLELEYRSDLDAIELNTNSPISHVSFQVDSVDNYFELLTREEILDGSENIRDMGPVKILYFRGINGLMIELIEKVAQS